MKSRVVGFLIMLLLALAPALTGCAADPPRIALADVVDFAIVWGDASALDDPTSETEVFRVAKLASLDLLVSVYNKASGKTFYSETTPPLFARFWLRDGTRITLMFSSEFPEDHALVHVEPAGDSADTWYHVKDRGLPHLVGQTSWTTSFATRLSESACGCLAGCERPGDRERPERTGALMIIELADDADAPVILELQRRAYLDQAKLYDDFTLPPLTQTLEETLVDFQRQVVLKATIDGRLVGSVRGHLEKGTCHIARLMVEPGVQNQGIGTALLERIEEHFSDAFRFELFTGELSERSLHLYGKLGYRVFDTKRANDKVTLVFLEKLRHVDEQ